MLKKLFRKSGPVFDLVNFRKEWNKACVKVGLGKKTGKEWYEYAGPIPHDFCRSAVRNLISAGVDQATAMKDHRTPHRARVSALQHHQHRTTARSDGQGFQQRKLSWRGVARDANFSSVGL